MKILKYSLGVIAVLIVAFLLVGVFQPEVSYDSEIEVDKSLAEAWAVSQDEENMSEWMTGYQRMEKVSGTPGTVGAVSDVYFDTGGEEVIIRETITGLVPNESVSMDFETDFMNMNYELRMSPEGDKTKISTITTAKGTNMFTKSVMALMGSTLRAQENQNLAKLKKVIEDNTKNYFPTEDADSETAGSAMAEEQQ